MGALRILLLVGVVCGAGPAAAQTTHATGAPAWTSEPTPIDRDSQALERLPDKAQAPVNVDLYPLRLNARGYYRILDSISFMQDGKRYRLAGLEPVASSRTCRGADGTRWACGLRARAALSRLVSGWALRCAPRGTVEDFTLVECRRSGEDIGAAQVEAGHATLGQTGTRYLQQEQQAKTAKAGVWAAVAETGAATTR